MWDTSEYLTAAKTLGIPHPPGNPFFVLLGHIFSILPIAPTAAQRINLMAALTSALSAGIWFLVTERVLAHWLAVRWQRLTGASLAVIIGSTAFTVWSQSIVNEKVYTVALLFLAVVTWLVVVWSDDPDAPRAERLLILAAFLIGLGYTNHPAGFLVAPAVGVAILFRKPRLFLDPKFVLRFAIVLALGLTPFLYMPIRAGQFPALNEGYTTGCTTHFAWSCTLTKETAQRTYDHITRKQYGELPFIQRKAPLPAQLGMYWMYFKWQWLRDVAGRLSGLQAALGVVFLMLGLAGAVKHWQHDRATFWYYATLMLMVTPALILYLNFYYGWSQAPELGTNVLREVRDRDYFYLWSFSSWSVWIALGLVALWEFLAKRSSWITAAPVLSLAAIPFIANHGVAPRSEQGATRDIAIDLLNSVEPYGIIVTGGDNDLFPLWYAQEVEGVRKDVLVVTTSLLGLEWYAGELMNRPVYTYDAAKGPAVYRDRVWPKPTRPLFTMSWDDTWKVPDYVQIPGPMTFKKNGTSLEAVIDPRRLEEGVLMRHDIFVLHMIADGSGRPVYISTTYGQYGSTLGLQNHLLTQGLVRKVVDDPIVATRDTVMVPGDGWMDTSRSDALWHEQRGPASIEKHRGWSDPASVGMPEMYVVRGYALAEALQRRNLPGDAAKIEDVVGTANRVADVVGLRLNREIDLRYRAGYIRGPVRSAVARYALAVVSLAAALAVSLLGRRHDDALALCLAAVVLTTWIGGLGPGIVAAVIGIGAVDYAVGDYAIRDAAPHAVLFVVSVVIVAWARDELNERRRSEWQLAGQYALARVISQSSSWTEAAPRLLAAIGRITGWEWGALFMADRDGTKLKCREVWHADTLQGAHALDAASRGTVVQRDEGLIGRVWNESALAITRDVSAPGTLPPAIATAATAVGLTTLAGVPLRAGRETLGVLTLMTRSTPVPFSARQTETLTVLGEQIGQFTLRRRVEQDRESLASLVQNSSDFVGIASLEGNWMFINPAGQRLVGLDGDDDVRANPMRKLFVEDVTPAVLEHGYWSGQAHLRHAQSGAVVPVLQHIFTLTALERPVALAVIGRDLTEIERRNEQLRRNEAYLAEAQRLSQTGSWALKVPSGIRQWSRESFRIFGIDPGTVVTREIFESFVHPNDRARVMQVLDRAIHERTGLDITYRIMRPDGTVRYAQSVGRPILNAAGEVEELVGVVMDVTERKRAARALRRARERALTARFAAILDERARVAREIHDSLLQGVTGIALQLRAMLPHVTPADTLQRIVELADHTSREARRAIWDLRSSAIADDITGALDDAARRHLAGTSVAFHITVTGRPRVLSSSLVPAAVRIIEEALTNVARHADAQSVWLTVAYAKRIVRITLADNGHGFDTAATREGHWGLIGMHERANEIGAQLDIRSTPGHGTDVVLELPISRRGE